MLSFFFFSLSCGKNRAREAESAAGPRAARSAGLLARSPPSCRAAPLCAGAAAAPFDPDTHACATRKAPARPRAPRWGVAGKPLATPATGTGRHGGGGGAGAARSRLPPPCGPGEGYACPAGPARCGDPAPRSSAGRGTRPAWPRGSLGDPRPLRGQPAGPEPRRDLAGLSPSRLPSPPRRPFQAAASLISARL